MPSISIVLFLLLGLPNLDKLILIDFLCHGTVPQEFLDAELAKLKRKYIFDEITFRSNKKEENCNAKLLK